MVSVISNGIDGKTLRRRIDLSVHTDANEPHRAVGRLPPQRSDVL